MVPSMLEGALKPFFNFMECIMDVLYIPAKVHTKNTRGSVARGYTVNAKVTQTE